MFASFKVFFKVELDFELIEYEYTSCSNWQLNCVVKLQTIGFTGSRVSLREEKKRRIELMICGWASSVKLLRLSCDIANVSYLSYCQQTALFLSLVISNRMEPKCSEQPIINQGHVQFFHFSYGNNEDTTENVWKKDLYTRFQNMDPSTKNYFWAKKANRGGRGEKLLHNKKQKYKWLKARKEKRTYSKQKKLQKMVSIASLIQVLRRHSDDVLSAERCSLPDHEKIYSSWH